MKTTVFIFYKLFSDSIPRLLKTTHNFFESYQLTQGGEGGALQPPEK